MLASPPSSPLPSVTKNYIYDAAGNVSNDGVHTYPYDEGNRLVSVDGGATAQYAYDENNRRYKKTVGSAVNSLRLGRLAASRRA